jgi:hypothetical protein
MPRVQGCWANVLDDCDGPLSAEHLMSVAIFAAAEGMPNNRRGRLVRRVTVRNAHHIPDGEYTVEQLTANILCRHHNNSTSELDEEGGRFARAIENWTQTNAARGWLPLADLNRRSGIAGPTWNRRAFEVDGPRLERLFLKLAINNAFLFGQLPIGGPDAEPAWPTRELVEMVYGRRPITRPAGLFYLATVGDQYELAQESFAPLYWDNGRHREGCVWMFRTMTIGVQFTTQQMPERMFDRVEALRGSTRLQPFNELNSPHNVALRLRW